MNDQSLEIKTKQNKTKKGWKNKKITILLILLIDRNPSLLKIQSFNNEIMIYTLLQKFGFFLISIIKLIANEICNRLYINIKALQ
jgi:hypothetical protein